MVNISKINLIDIFLISNYKHRYQFYHCIITENIKFTAITAQTEFLDVDCWRKRLNFLIYKFIFICY